MGHEEMQKRVTGSKLAVIFAPHVTTTLPNAHRPDHYGDCRVVTTSRRGSYATKNHLHHNGHPRATLQAANGRLLAKYRPKHKLWRAQRVAVGGYSNYTANDIDDADRRRSYTLTLPGMGYAAAEPLAQGVADQVEGREVSNTYSTPIANLQNGSDQGDNKQHPSQPMTDPTVGKHATIAEVGAGRDETQLNDAEQLMHELGATAEDAAVPIGRETEAEFDPHAIWRMVLGELALQMPSSTYDTWVRDTVVIGYEDGEFIIGMPNAYARDWLENRLRHTIKRSLSSIMHRAVQIQFRVRPRPVQDPVRAASAPLYEAVDEESVVTNANNSPRKCPPR